MRFVTAILLASLCFGANELSNRRAPGFSLPDSSFKRYDPQDFRGKWLLIDFMRTDCPHCQALSATLEQIKRKHAARVVILSVVIGPPDTMETVQRYINQNKVTVPILFDQGQVAASYFNLTPEKHTYDTPHLFVVDPAGKIVRDFGHSAETHTILEGPGLMKEIDALVTAKP